MDNTAPLMVSPQHRMLIEDWRAAYFCGLPEVFVPAKHLVNGTTVTQVEGGTVDYMHLLFERHEVIYAFGQPSESYFPGHALDVEDRAAQAELAVLFPRLKHQVCDAMQTAHPVIKKREAHMIARCA
ncbi:MAG: hypothetical protein ACI8R4_001916 [Paracoccaceae bacterium]